MKKITAVILSLVMLLSVAPAAGGLFAVKANAAEKKITEYKAGDIIEFGYYPQSQVTSHVAIKSLDSKIDSETKFNSFNYYSGTGIMFDGNMTANKDIMYYTDVIHSGEKYRCVTIKKYRPDPTGYESSAKNSWQEQNGYMEGGFYWFKFEPVKWRVLDPAEGLILSEPILDSQAYQNYCLYADEKYWGDSAKTFYSNYYVQSSIRQWLNTDFYNTAFSADQQKIIEYTEFDNPAYTPEYSESDFVYTSDKIYLLSYADVLNAKYGFIESETADFARMAKGTDYAKCQGLAVRSNDNSDWILRSPGVWNGFTEYGEVDFGGRASTAFYPYKSADGVRPALRLNTQAEIVQSDVKYTGRTFNDGRGKTKTKITDFDSGDIIKFGYYPQSEVTKSSLVNNLNNAIKGTSEWISYNYYSGTGSMDDGKMTANKDIMYYTDVIYNGEKYRGVKIKQYRPSQTGYDTSLDRTDQDDNGYMAGNTYWFKFEPVKWRVLDPEEGLILSEPILDSQAYIRINYGCRVFRYSPGFKTQSEIQNLISLSLPLRLSRGGIINCSHK